MALGLQHALAACVSSLDCVRPFWPSCARFPPPPGPRARTWVWAPGVTANSAGDLSSYDDPGGRTGRLLLGKRFGPWAIEAVALGTGVSDFEGRSASTLSLGGDVKFHLGLLLGLELYVRGGAHHTWMAVGADQETRSSMAIPEGGAGLAYGAGLSWRFTAIPGLQAGIWADAGRQVIGFHEDDVVRASSALDVVTIGVTLGSM